MSWRLIFSGFRSPGWAAYAVLAVVATLVLSIWLMRLERRLVSRQVGWTLMSLRIAVLMTLLVTMLQPVLTKQFDVSQSGRVIVALDGSLSMETQDRHASLGEKLRWAQALGMLGNAETESLIDQWVAAADEGREPNWAGTESPPANEAEQSLADSRERQIRDTLEELAGMPRTEFVRRLLMSQPRMLLDRMDDVIPTDIRLFAAEQQSASAKNLTELLDSDRAQLAPGGTDVIELLEAVTSEEGAGQIRAVVLISDGRQTVPGDIAGSARRLNSLGVPVYSVPVGSRLPPRDLSVAAVEAPEAVFLNDKARIRAVIGTSGFEGEPVVVRLQKDGVSIDEQTVTPSTDTATVTFSVPSDQAGRFDYQLTTEPQEGELRDDNNVRDISIQVVDNKARVLLVEGDARWEFRYLRNLLERDKQVESQTVLFRQPYINLLNEPYIPGVLPPAEAFRELLSRTDLLVVGDVSPVQVDPGVWELIEQAVTRDGLTLVVIPGRRDMPHSFQSLALSALLPIADSRQRLAEQLRKSDPDSVASAFHLTLSQDARSMSMFQLSSEPGSANTALSSLPGHPWIYGGEPKPGATVWATSSLAGTDLAPEPTIIHHDYGFGQVLWMGIDSTWRWRMRAGDQYHYKYWGQLIRWAARNKAASGNDDVRMTLSDVVLDESENVETVVRWNPKLLPQLEGATVEVTATAVTATQVKATEGQAGTTEAISESRIAASLKASAEAPERFTGRLPRLTPGTWKLELKVTGGALTLKESIASEVVVRQQISAELAHVSCNRDLLQQLSELSGGELIEPFDAERLISLVQPKDQTEQKIQERTLWDHWLILVLFFTLLTSEWVIRKLNGLP